MIIEKNLFAEFDEILLDRVHRLENYEPQYAYLKAEVERKVCSIYYGKNAFYLGHFCPSLIMDKITRNYKRDKLRKNIPQGGGVYVSYEIDHEGKLLRMNEINSFGTVFETYIIRNGNEEYSITFQNGIAQLIIDSVKVLYENNRIIRCDFIGTAAIWSEIYDYKNIKLNLIHCTQCYYVPELNGSDKSKKAGQLNSPMQQWEARIHVDSSMNVMLIEYGELIEGNVELLEIYEAK